MDPRELSNALEVPQERYGAELRQAEVMSVEGATCTIRIGGSTDDIADTVALSGYSPSAGDTVWVFKQGPLVLIAGKESGGGGGLSTVVLPADVVSSATATATTDLTGMSFPVTAGKKYYFRMCVQYTSTSTTSGGKFSISGPGGTARFMSRFALTATTEQVNHGLELNNEGTIAATSADATANIGWVEGFYEASATGTLIGRLASDTASGITAKAGSVMHYQEVL